MELIDALFDLCSASKYPIIAIDGPAGAGKTTLADHLRAALSLKYKTQTLHMDDFYNGWSAPFDHHFTDALSAICVAHQQAKPYSVARYDWHQGRYGTAEEIPAAELLILEGVGSSQKLLRQYLTAVIWIEIDPVQGFERVLTRDGESLSAPMKEWLIKQAQLFSENDSQNAADFVLTN